MTQRFDPIQYYDMGGSGYGDMKECPDGDYVRVEDYEKLLKKLELARVQYLGCGGNLKPQEIVDNIHKILDSE
jgi:hypothetical protein